MRPYKGYTASLSFDEDDVVFHGRIVGIRDIYTFEARTAAEVPKAFHEAVDDYLAFCIEKGRAPDKPFNGKIALRVTPETHRLIATAAASDDKSINQWMAAALESAVAALGGATKIRSRK